MNGKKQDNHKWNRIHIYEAECKETLKTVELDYIEQRDTKEKRYSAEDGIS